MKDKTMHSFEEHLAYEKGYQDAQKIYRQRAELSTELLGAREEDEQQQINNLCNSVIMVAEKFIQKCKDGRARSTETLSDMVKIKLEAERLKVNLNP